MVQKVEYLKLCFSIKKKKFNYSNKQKKNNEMRKHGFTNRRMRNLKKYMEKKNEKITIIIWKKKENR